MKTLQFNLTALIIKIIFNMHFIARFFLFLFLEAMRLISDIKNDHFEPINFIQVRERKKSINRWSIFKNIIKRIFPKCFQYTALHSLKRWSELNRSSLTAPIAYTSLARQTTPFPYQDEINGRFILWEGDISLLNADAIVNTTNENLCDNNCVSNRIINRAGSGLADELKAIKGEI